ncbi:MAG: polymer-forming cytoskeletal protein [Acidobacteria bacterium]|nr:MAG: polymer-forming cytoskeletal protein [Acidobacteriota bacterium]REJ99611.1 MAG: polymer-forming cytoskeletal protein [Acidobacteriota bacterium]
MFKSERSGDLNGFLDAGSRLTGELEFEDTFRVDGAFTGKIRSPGDLVVGAEGSVEGEIHAGRVFVSGTVRGEIRAEKRLEISERGRVYADVITPALVIEEGAFLEGRCAMERAVTQGTVAAEEAQGKSAGEVGRSGNKPTLVRAPTGRATVP